MDDWITRLAADEETLSEGAGLIVDAWLRKTTLRSLVDLEPLTELCVSVFSRAHVAAAMEQHVSPAWDRHRARTEAHDDRFGDWIPEEEQETLLTLVSQVELPRGEWAREVIDAELVRELMAPVLQEVLLSFVRKLPLSAKPLAGISGVAGGLAGKLSKTAQKSRLANMGRSVIGGVEERFTQAAREFSQSAVAILRDALHARLEHPEGQALLAKIQRRAAERLLKVKVAAVMSDVESSMPREALEAILPKLTEHAVSRPFARETFRAEVRTALGSLGDRSVHETLERAEVTAHVRPWLVEVCVEAMKSALMDDPFADWLRRAF